MTRRTRTISVSRRWLYHIGLVVLIGAAIAGLAVLGRAVTPRDASGEPLLLSPSLKAALEYRAQARRWIAQLQSLDADLETLLTEERDIYYQTEAVDDLLERALGLAGAIEIRDAPAALAGLRGLLAQTSHVYLETARAAADWVGAPLPENARAVRDLLEQARALLAQVEGSRWLEEPAPQAPGQERDPSSQEDPEDEGQWWTP